MVGVMKMSKGFRLWGARVDNDWFGDFADAS
jgi:hypothetical protein